MDELKIAFERHANSEGLNLKILNGSDRYNDYATMVAWSAWNAALRYRYKHPDHIRRVTKMVSTQNSLPHPSGPIACWGCGIGGLHPHTCTKTRGENG